MSIAVARRLEDVAFEDVVVPIPAGFTLESGDRNSHGKQLRQH